MKFFNEEGGRLQYFTIKLLRSEQRINTRNSRDTKFQANLGVTFTGVALQWKNSVCLSVRSAEGRFLLIKKKRTNFVDIKICFTNITVSHIAIPQYT
jgi:hypothetical protein